LKKENAIPSLAPPSSIVGSSQGTHLFLIIFKTAFAAISSKNLSILFLKNADSI